MSAETLTAAARREPGATRRADVPAVVGLTALLAAMAFASWRAWGDPVADFPKQLYMAWRIGEGEILYRDIRHFYGPLSQLWNGGLFALFGPSYLILILSNLLVALGLTLLLYFLVARCIDRFSGCVAAGAFVLIHVFQQLGLNASYNFIGPYSHESTHGALLVFLLIALLALPVGSVRSWIVAGATLGGLVLTKPELVLAGASLAVAALTVDWIDFRSPARVRAMIVAMAAGTWLPLLLCVAYFLTFGGASLREAVGWTFGGIAPLFSASAHTNPIYGEISGLSILNESVGRIGETLLIILGILAGGICIDLMNDVLRRWLGIAYLVCVALLLYLLADVVPPYSFAYALPVISTLGTTLVVFTMARSDGVGRAEKLALLVGVAAVTLSLKIYFNATFWWMGFSLLVPSTVFLVLLGMHIVPAFLQRAPARTFVVRWATLVVVGAMSLHVAWGSLWTYGTKNLALGEGLDRFHVLGSTMESQLMHEVVHRLSTSTEPDSTLMVFPGAVLANYLLRKRNPTPYVANLGSRTWYEFSGGSSAIVGAMERTPPDYVVYVRSPPQFPGPAYQIWGPEGFANALLAWIGEHYDEVDRVGPRSQSFGELVYVLLKKRKDAFGPE